MRLEWSKQQCGDINTTEASKQLYQEKKEYEFMQ